MVFGVGSFTHGVMAGLQRDGAEASAYLTRDYGHHGPALVGRCYDAQRHPSPLQPIRKEQPALIVPMAIEWALKPWAQDFLDCGVPILCPSGKGLLLERDRSFATRLCQQHRIPAARAFRAKSRAQAERLIRRQPRAWVIKNPLCSPFSPVHTIVCETAADSLAWLDRVDDSEGIFLQEYLGTREAGHVALVTGGEIHSLATNQEYKRAFDGNLGIVAGAPLGGLIQQDANDRYGLARELLHPLLPWFRKVNYHGPVQVTAVRRRQRWQVIEYNVRLGITCGPLLLQMLQRPTETLLAVAHNRPITPRFRPARQFGCSLTLAGFGYPYVSLSGPRLPVETTGTGPGDTWWGEVAQDTASTLRMTGHRIADVTALAKDLSTAIDRAYRTIRRIRCLGSYYRHDIGQSLWPPGSP